jgi:hypothetical protein
LLTVLAASASTSSVWTVLPALIAAAALLVGLVAGALLEPLKLRFAHRARLRQERLAQCGRLIETVRLVAATWDLLAGLHIKAREHDEELDYAFVATEVLKLEVQRDHLFGAVMLLRLYGPNDLEAAARAVTDVENKFLETMQDHEDSVTKEEVEDFDKELKEAIDAFVTKAQRYTR